MVVCKYYRQGNCRFGQYCQFEHTNTFGNNAKSESYNEDEYTVILVAKEVLNAERGGQWLLSCFAPMKERPCIPGMEDLSPEEVRWEMYQAQKNGMVEQAKLHFQQLCQDIKAKREALKNPSRETMTMLKELLGTGQKGRITTGGNTAAKSSNFAFATPQLGLPSNTSASNVFGAKTFGTQSNPFSGGFTASSNSSVFGKSNTSNPVFGGTPTFGGSLGFGGATSTNSVFGGTTNTGQNTQTFVSSGSIFGGGSSQSVFGQSSVFGGSNQVNNVFARPQTSQSTTSVFNNSPASSSLFTGSATQSSTSLFGGANPPAANPFSGSSTLQTTNSLFGTTPSSGTFSSGIFSQSKTVPAFGGAPVFGGGANFGNAAGPMFGEPPTFGSSSNIFGGSNAAPPTFTAAAQTANTFGATASTPAVNIFGNAQSTPSIPTSNASPFGTTTTTDSSPFAPATSQFEVTNTTASPFARPTFGISTGSTSETFGTTVSSSTTPFGTTVTPSSAPFGTTSTGVTFGTQSTTTSSPFTTSTFGDPKSSPFASTNTTVTTTTTNPFVPRTQQTTFPFGNFAQAQTVVTPAAASSIPFGKSPFGTTVVTDIIDDSVYSIEGQLTDDDKSMYLAERFIFGKIPLKPPTKDIR